MNKMTAKKLNLNLETVEAKINGGEAKCSPSTMGVAKKESKPEPRGVPTFTGE